MTVGFSHADVAMMESMEALAVATTVTSAVVMTTDTVATEMAVATERTSQQECS